MLVGLDYIGTDKVPQYVYIYYNEQSSAEFNYTDNLANISKPIKIWKVTNPELVITIFQSIYSDILDEPEGNVALDMRLKQVIAAFDTICDMLAKLEKIR